MLMRANQQPIAAPGSYNPFSRNSPAQRFEDSSTDDHLAKRRFQRSTSVGDGKALPVRRDPRPMTAGRVKDGDLELRPHQRQVSSSNSRPSVDSTHSSVLHNTAGNIAFPFPLNDAHDSNITTFYAYRGSTETDNTNHTFDFSSVNFDDLHQSLSVNELNEFPAPGGGGQAQSNMDSRTPQPAPAPTQAQRVGRSNSMSRRPSLANRKGLAVSDGPQSIRGRRQSAFPTTNAGAVRQPRKSIAIASDEGTVRAVHSQRPSVVQRSTEGSIHGTVGSVPSTLKVPGADERRSLAALRAAKAKSLQPPPRHMERLGDDLPTPDRPGSNNRLSTMLSPRSPAQRTHTPSSTSSRRLSAIPPHATGLGARTISPTDARRMKRLSSLQPPPMPGTPQTPQPDFTLSTRSATQSPSMIPRKSTTPSSARGTPDLGRKSAVTSAPASNVPSARTSSSSLQRMVQNASMNSRLPTPKPRLAHGSPDEEDVPPVPAIPKAYESPKDMPADMPYFSQRKSSLPFDTSSVTSSSSALEKFRSSVSSNPAKPEPRPRANLPVHEPEKRPVGSTVAKKNLQPLRLPPLNLLPLGTPMLNRVAQMQGPQAPEPRLTPPPRRTTLRTPSTPMTASKTAFFAKGRNGEDRPFHEHNRSASTHQLPSETASQRAASSSGSSAVVSYSRHGRQTISPFLAASRPKNSGEFVRARPMTSSEYTVNTAASDLKHSKAAARQQKAPEEPKLASSPAPDTPSSGNSIKRKLSLSWKRNSPKSSSNNEKAEPPAKTSMPPPRLPASATFNGQITPSPSPSTNKVPVVYESKIHKNPTPAAHERNKSESWAQAAAAATAAASPKKESKAGDRNTVGILSPMQRILGSKSSNAKKAPELIPGLDNNDNAAEEEMAKLARRRKDTEQAAAEMDALKKRAVPVEQISPEQALRSIALNIFERGEIVDYKEIYFCGTPNAKKHVGDLNSQNSNFGYDDDRGDYAIVPGDHLSYRYEVVDVLGKGSFGQVVRCVDHKTGGLVAIKIIRNKKRFHQQALVEVNILQKLREWDPEDKHNMVSFTQSFYFRGHLCISTELLGMNLYEFIKSNEFRGFSLTLIRRFTRQLLNSLILLQRQRVIHCDLKPENVLLSHPAHSEIKVIDFGSSCFENEKVYTYIQSRFYRSPEVILGMSYGLPIDMWSLGCILAELYTGYPIFPGENEQEQLACIMEIFGPPEKHLIEKSTRRKLFFDSLGKPRPTVSSKGRRRRPSSKTLQQAIKCEDDAFLDFITRCLRWDPDRRMRPDDALLHEFCTGIRRPKGRSGPVDPRSRSQPGSRAFPDHPTIRQIPGGRMQRLSPVKTAGSGNKRHSVVGVPPANITNGVTSGAKRGSTAVGTAQNSGLPTRVTPRGPPPKGHAYS